MQAKQSIYSFSSQSLSFPCIPHSGGASLERPLIRTDDILSQSGRSSVISAFCGVKGEETLRAVQCADGAAVSRASDLQRVGQTAAGVAGVAHSVQGFPGKLCRALHQTAGSHVGHVGGHHDGSDALGIEAVGDDVH